ncbi:MAG: 5'-deoxyadenosine deaminase [Ignavibacteriales bacterium]|nr:5'-deoxyadenosine deaminase [Ignavibacteriales bacterium]
MNREQHRNQILLQVGTIVTMNARRDVLSDCAILIEENRIKNISLRKHFKNYSGKIIEAKHLVAIPGFIQTHLHLCQTLFRGLADDLQLLDWLLKKIMPFEFAHNEKSMHASAMLGIAELIRGGTTTILDMGSISHEEEIIRAIGESGLRAYVGKAMMDRNDLFPKLKESRSDALNSTRKLAEEFHNSFNERVKYAAAPRFVLSCSEKLLRDVGELVASFDGMLMHTHASENKHEIATVRQMYGKENIEVLNALGLLSEKSVLAHCIHLNEKEISLLKKTKANVAHCPSSNLKLASGIANIPKYLNNGINVSLGADGAPCNNNLNQFQEMKLAALIQKPLHGSTSMPAEQVFELATINGAKALSLEKEIGSLEVGKKADLVLLNLNNVWNGSANFSSYYSNIVYSATSENVDSVMIDGKWILRNREFATLDEEKIVDNGKQELQKLLNRCEV